METETVPTTIQPLWEGYKKRNPHKKKIDPSVIDNFSEKRVEQYAVLARVSTKMQSQDGESLDVQVSKAKRLIEEKGGVLHKIYREEGVSAYKNLIEERQAMRELKDDIINGRVNHIITYKRNRISRNGDDRRSFFKFLKEYGCKLTLTSDGKEVDIFETEKHTVLMESVQGQLDEISSKETSENVTETMWELAMYQGRIMGGQAPIGFKAVYTDVDKDNGSRIPSFVPLDDFESTKYLIEELYLSGYGYTSIAKYLNGGKVRGLEQLATPVKKPKTNDTVSDTWNDKNIDTILFSPVYTGYKTYQINKHEGYEPVVNKSQYITPFRSEERQKELNLFKENKKSKIEKSNNVKLFATPFLLSGLVVCKHCGSVYENIASKGKGSKRYGYYRCRNKFSNRKHDCESVTYSQSILEPLVLDKVEWLLRKLFKSGVYKKIKSKLEEKKEVVQDDFESISTKIEKLNQKASNIIDEISELDRNHPMYEMKRKTYNEKEEAIYRELMELKSMLSNVEQKSEEVYEEEFSIKQIIKLVEESHNTLRYSSLEKQKVILEKLIHEIIVDKDFGVDIVFNFNWELEVGGTGTTFIESENIREGIISDNIKVTLNKNVLSFNIVHEMNFVLNLLSNNFYNFLVDKQPKISPQYYSELPQATRMSLYESLGINVRSTQKSTVASNMVFDRMFSISNHSARNRIRNGLLPNTNIFFDMIQLVGSKFDELREYIEEKTNYNLHDEELTREILDSRLNKNKVSAKNKYLMSDYVECGCCGRYYKGVSRTGVSIKYRCVDNRPDKNEKRCHSKVVDEKELINEIKLGLGTRENITEELLRDKIEKIIVDKNGAFNITYK